MLRIITTTIGSTVLLLMSWQAMADGIPIESGQWNINTAIVMPMMSGERHHELTQCIDTDTIDPVKMLGTGEECQVTNQNVAGNTVTWEVSCNTDGGPATGSGSFTSAGSTANGNMQIQFSVQGQTLKMNTRWEGERVGDC